MQVSSPHGQAASIVAAAATLSASRPPECDWAALKKDRYTARELRLAGCSIASLLALQYDVPSLVAACLDTAALRAAGYNWATISAAGFSAKDAKDAGCDLETAKSAEFGVPSLVKAFGFDAVVASGCDMSSYILVS